ncbi:methyltransferase NSUN6, partial [Asbolus verrucosus]
MPYPKSPFRDDVDAGILFGSAGDEETTVNEIQKGLEILEWLCQTPEITSFRVNTLKADPGDVREYIRTHVQKVLGADSALKIEQHPHCEEAIIIHHPKVANPQLKINDNEVIVDTVCAAAVLRGAHIYAPGVMGMTSGSQIGGHVSVYADVAKKCKKGLQRVYNHKKIFLGNGIIKMDRHQLFRDNHNKIPPTGVAVKMVETISNCPPLLGDDFLPTGVALLQNLPSIICVHVLDPRPQDTILDMCASPGNKTTHIAALLKNQGKLIAIDKTSPKIAQLKQRCETFGAQVEVIQADSTKLVEECRLSPKTFDKILLDAPCSALGKRPQLLNTTRVKVLRSYVPLQRKLFQNAVQLLKDDGMLVYSTCTVTLAENEGIVAWALKNFDLDLVEASPLLAGQGLQGTRLKEDDLKKLQRFGPAQSIDS